MTVHNLKTAPDADAAYVLDQMAEADKADAEVKFHDDSRSASARKAEVFRLNAGQRLKEVYARMYPPDGGASGGDTYWTKWLRDTGIPETTARRLMTRAGWTEEQRKEAKDAEAERKRNERAKKREEKGFTQIGWEAALRRYCPEVFGNMALGGQQREKIEKFMRVPIGKYVGLKFQTEEEARQFAVQAALAFKEQEKRDDQFTKKEESALAKAIREEIAKIRQAAAEEIDAEVKRRIEPIRLDYMNAIEAARKEKASYEAGSKHLEDWITYEDFQVVIGCLHPDRAPAGLEDRYRRAFQVMNRLKVRFRQ
jgi:hypothetical protein